MFWHVVRKALSKIVLSLVLLASLHATQAGAAQSMEIHSSCWASGSLSEDLVTIVHSPARWNCRDRAYSLEGERAFLRFEIGPDYALPQYFFSGRSALAKVHLL